MCSVWGEGPDAVPQEKVSIRKPLAIQKWDMEVMVIDVNLRSKFLRPWDG